MGRMSNCFAYLLIIDQSTTGTILSKEMVLQQTVSVVYSQFVFLTHLKTMRCRSSLLSFNNQNTLDDEDYVPLFTQPCDNYVILKLQQCQGTIQTVYDTPKMFEIDYVVGVKMLVVFDRTRGRIQHKRQAIGKRVGKEVVWILLLHRYYRTLYYLVLLLSAMSVYVTWYLQYFTYDVYYTNLDSPHN